MFKCDFCDRILLNKGGCGKHMKTCKSNPDRVERCGGALKNSIPWNKGLNKEIDDRVLKQSVATKGRDFGFVKGSKHTEQYKKDQSKRMHERYASGWECVAGRCKKYKYHSEIAGDVNVNVDGTWELKFCKFLDSIKLTCVRNKERFAYINLDGKHATYQPDFYIEDLNTFIEVKGYETDLDKCKWEQFPHALIVLRRYEINNLTEWYQSLGK